MGLDLSAFDIDIVRAEKSRRSLKQFIRLFWNVVEPSTPFVDGWHIDCFCDHLTHLAEIKNLLVNVPPGTSKSLVFAVFFPAWRWLHDPTQRFLCGSYSTALAVRDNLKCRKLIGSELYRRAFGDVYTIPVGQDTKQHFENDRTGYRQAVAVGASSTGFKANYVILDDPHNATEAASPLRRQQAVTWYADAFQNRLNDFAKDCRVVIGQRIAKDDLSGYILDGFADAWTHLCLPYEYRPTAYVSPLGWRDPRTDEGQPLWPERFTEEGVRPFRRNKRTWSSQWNQLPVDVANALINPAHFRYYEEDAHGYRLGEQYVEKGKCFKLASCDLAFTTGTRSDYTAVVVAAVGPTGDIVVLHVHREKMAASKIIPTLAGLNRQYEPHYTVIEDVLTQRMVIDQCRAEGLPVRGVRPEGSDKEARSLPLQIKFETGQVWFPKDRPWLNVLEEELVAFPDGRHDDVVDALSYLVIEATRRTRGRPAAAEHVQERKEEDLYQELLWAGTD